MEHLDPKAQGAQIATAGGHVVPYSHNQAAAATVDEALPSIQAVPIQGKGRKSINLRAFNLYAAQVRKETREQYPEITGYDIERLIGKKWAKLPEDERKEFKDEATREREEMVRQGLIEPDSGEKVRRKRRRKNEVDLLALALKQKNPETVLQQMPGLVKPKKVKGGHVVDASEGDGSPAAALIGTPVSGLIDGMFDAGFFVTLKVGEKKQVYKGVIFRPDVGVPPGCSDIAPKVWTMETRAGAGKGGQPGATSLREEDVYTAAVPNGELGVDEMEGVTAQEDVNGREGVNAPESGNGHRDVNGQEDLGGDEGVDTPGEGTQPEGVNGRGGVNGQEGMIGQEGTVGPEGVHGNEGGNVLESVNNQDLAAGHGGVDYGQANGQLGVNEN